MKSTKVAIERYLKDIYYKAKSPVAYASQGKLWRFIKSDPKRPIGIDIKTLKSWLEKQDTHNVFKTPPKDFPTEGIVVEYPDQMWDCDIMVMEDAPANRGYRYVICFIDLFTRYLWVRPLKKKTALESAKALESVLEEGRKCDIIRTDDGGEFGGAFRDALKKHGIQHRKAYGANKANYVERVQRTIQTKLYKYFYAENTRNFIDVIDAIVEAYNNATHGSTGVAPAKINKDNYVEIYEKLYIPQLHKRAAKTPIYSFDIGDLVRISLTRGAFVKGYTQKFTEELFRVKNKIPSDPPRYRLEDLHREDIKGSFYAEDLQKFHLKDIDKVEFKIEKVLGTRKINGRPHSLIKWLGYADKFNTYIPTSSIKKGKK
jgi:hypothetical protein